jgi:hypothetical protein
VNYKPQSYIRTLDRSEHLSPRPPSQYQMINDLEFFLSQPNHNFNQNQINHVSVLKQPVPLPASDIRLNPHLVSGVRRDRPVHVGGMDSVGVPIRWDSTGEGGGTVRPGDVRLKILEEFQKIEDFISKSFQTDKTELGN